jgi:hypothetical protein
VFSDEKLSERPSKNKHQETVKRLPFRTKKHTANRKETVRQVTK